MIEIIGEPGRPATEEEIQEFLNRKRKIGRLMERVKIKVADTAELVVDITDKMAADHRECRELAEKNDCDGKECHSCSLNASEFFCFGLCEIPEVVDAIESMRSHDW